MILPLRTVLTAVLGVSVFTLIGCDLHVDRTGPLETMPINVPLGSAERSKLELDLAAGQLNLNGGAAGLLQGSIEYNVPSWKPEVHTSNIGSSIDVVIKQPEGHGFSGGNHQYNWNLSVSNNVLLDVAINCGAGKQDLKLGDAKLRSVTVHIGAGEVNLDLRGQPTRDYDVAISGGVGHAKVNLPTGVGIWAEAHGGIGHIDVRGLQKNGNHWENDAYDTAKVNVHVKVEGGIGQIEILAE
jgi:N-terminal domain of toast_rack, DUF2154